MTVGAQQGRRIRPDPLSMIAAEAVADTIDPHVHLDPAEAS